MLAHGRRHPARVEEQQQANKDLVATNERLLASKLKLEVKLEKLKQAATGGSNPDDVTKVFPASSGETCTCQALVFRYTSCRLPGLERLCLGTRGACRTAGRLPDPGDTV